MPMPPWWHPDALMRRRRNLAVRRAIRRAWTNWFEGAGFEEVETPILTPMPGAETHLHAFATEMVGPNGARATRYLHTSPELAMKKLLVAGVPRLFQFARVFRNGEVSPLHHPEFTMLEWYRADADWRRVLDDTVTLLRLAANAAEVDRFRSGPVACDPFAPWDVVSVAEAFARWADIDLAGCLDNRDRFAAAAATAGVRVADGDDWETLFFRVMLDRIDPHLGVDRPTVLTDWPTRLGALARRRPDDPRWVERFEVYVAGVELANAFGELTDPVEQRLRMTRDMARKRDLYGADWPIDEDFLAALKHGMPPSAGIALGLDRLVMLATGADRVEDVLWAPTR
jgi:lysyl-tRNA synthetase class 2